MPNIDARNSIRATARAYELNLPASQRKQLGQYFTGMPLGKLLAHLALDADTRTVLDPMAGHGDLLDATLEAATERGITLDCMEGIEVDESTAAACRKRLHELTDGDAVVRQILAGDAFDPTLSKSLSLQNYDLVITNPPYVRYQKRNTNGFEAPKIRSGLLRVIEDRLVGADREVWTELTESYSGLADLSVPAWLLAAAMVRPGGRLALVIPATWRSRDYADVIRYLMLRCFSLEYIVEDEQPGWFSDALVRTHLIVARRLTSERIATRVRDNPALEEIPWLQIAPAAAGPGSLVGEAFPGSNSEKQFAAWLDATDSQPTSGITVRPFPLSGEWNALESRIKRRQWYMELEGREAVSLPLFGLAQPAPGRVAIPDGLAGLLPAAFNSEAIVTLDAAGIELGQGLRTGCNKFFYVTLVDVAEGGMAHVKASSLFGHKEFSVPATVLRPVLRKQSELASLEDGCSLQGRVMNLRGWVLPEDWPVVVASQAAYVATGETPPRQMPDDLASYVRTAAAISPADDDAKKIPELSAVRTNVRTPRNGHITPRFWYMLPDFAPRHVPAAFVARINHGIPWIEANSEPALLIDANFSTFWSPAGSWTRYGLKGLLNSAWCRAFMESLGTPLGGGALKLEATHLRQLAVPILSETAKTELARTAQELRKTSKDAQSRIDEIVLGALLGGSAPPAVTKQLAKALASRANDLSCARQRAA